jgi:spermidine/putrescine transport system permease protein
LAQDRDLIEAAANSLIIAVVATALATVCGTMAAYALWKRASGWISGALYLSLVTPEIVTGVSLLAFFQWAFRFLNLRLGMHTVILAHVGFSLAYVVVVLLARLRTFDPALEEAAMDLGATEFTAFRAVTVPYLAPAIAAAAMLAFTVSIDDYVITSLVAGVDSQTLPMAIYALARRGVSPMLNAVSTIIVAGLGALVLASERLRAK